MKKVNENMGLIAKSYERRTSLLKRSGFIGHEDDDKSKRNNEEERKDEGKARENNQTKTQTNFYDSSLNNRVSGKSRKPEPARQTENDPPIDFKRKFFEHYTKRMNGEPDNEFFVWKGKLYHSFTQEEIDEGRVRELTVTDVMKYKDQLDEEYYNRALQAAQELEDSYTRTRDALSIIQKGLGKKNDEGDKKNEEKEAMAQVVAKFEEELKNLTAKIEEVKSTVEGEVLSKITDQLMDLTKEIRVSTKDGGTQSNDGQGTDGNDQGNDGNDNPGGDEGGTESSEGGEGGEGGNDNDGGGSEGGNDDGANQNNGDEGNEGQ